MLKTAGTLAISAALLLPLSACGSTTATSAAPAPATATQAGTDPSTDAEPLAATSSGPASPAPGVPAPTQSESGTSPLTAKNGAWDAKLEEEAAAGREALCLGLDGEAPLLKKGTVLWASSNNSRTGDFVVDVAQLGLVQPEKSGSGLMPELELALGRLTMADLAVGSVVYYLEPQFDIISYRGGSQQHFSPLKIPAFKKIPPIAMFPASACEGLRAD